MEDAYDKYDELVFGKTHEIIQVTKAGDVDRLKVLLHSYEEDGRAFNVCDGQGWQAIHYACQLNDCTILQTILEADPELIHSRTYEDVTPLIVAAGEGNCNLLKILLSLLSKDDIKSKTIHGMNSLYYAVVNPDKAKATPTALMLLETCSDFDYIIAANESENIPFTVVRNRNDAVLKALLEAGLCTAYSHTYGFNAGYTPNLRTPADCILPANLAACCVKYNWPAGLKIVIEYHKNRISCVSMDNTANAADSADISKFVNSSCSVKDLLSSNCAFYCYIPDDAYKPIKLWMCSAWALSLAEGHMECFNIMVRQGFSVQDVCIFGDTEAYFPLVFALHHNILKKRDFLTTLFKMQSTEDLDFVLLRYKSFLHASDRHECIIGNPIEAVLRYCMSGVEESVETILGFLHECNFDFNFHSLPSHPLQRLDHGPAHQNTQSHCTLNLLMSQLLFEEPFIIHEYDFSVFVSMLRNLLSFDLNGDRCLEINSQTVAYTASLEVALSDLSDLSNTVLRLLAVKSVGIITSAYQDLEMDIEDRLLFQGSPAYIKSSSPLQIVKFLMKGFPSNAVCHQDHEVSYTQYGSLPLPVTYFFSQAWQKQKLLNRAERTLNFVETAERVDSLQFLCRRVIRQALGPARLIREPTPTKLTDDMVNGFEPMDWECSFIDRLSGLPPILKSYIKFIPEFRSFVKCYSEKNSSGNL